VCGVCVRVCCDSNSYLGFFFGSLIVCVRVCKYTHRCKYIHVCTIMHYIRLTCTNITGNIADMNQLICMMQVCVCVCTRDDVYFMCRMFGNVWVYA